MDPGNIGTGMLNMLPYALVYRIVQVLLLVRG